MCAVGSAICLQVFVLDQQLQNLWSAPLNYSRVLLEMAAVDQVALDPGQTLAPGFAYGRLSSKPSTSRLR